MAKHVVSLTKVWEMEEKERTIQIYNFKKTVPQAVQMDTEDSLAHG